MKALNAINAQVQERIQQRDSSGYAAASVYAELMKLKHAVGLAESQGSEVLKTYLCPACGRSAVPQRFKGEQQTCPGPGIHVTHRADDWLGP